MLNSLIAIKLIHTTIWAFFVACILAIFFFTAQSRLGLAAVLAAIVAVEVAVLFMNRMVCPLTDVAANYTSDRSANFDIYLPEWLAQNNKLVFGSLYMAALVYLLVSWLVPAAP